MKIPPMSTQDWMNGILTPWPIVVELGISIPGLGELDIETPGVEDLDLDLYIINP